MEFSAFDLSAALSNKHVLVVIDGSKSVGLDNYRHGLKYGVKLQQEYGVDNVNMAAWLPSSLGFTAPEEAREYRMNGRVDVADGFGDLGTYLFERYHKYDTVIVITDGYIHYENLERLEQTMSENGKTLVFIPFYLDYAPFHGHEIKVLDTTLDRLQ